MTRRTPVTDGLLFPGRTMTRVWVIVTKVHSPGEMSVIWTRRLLLHLPIKKNPGFKRFKLQPAQNDPAQQGSTLREMFLQLQEQQDGGTNFLGEVVGFPSLEVSKNNASVWAGSGTACPASVQGFGLDDLGEPFQPKGGMEVGGDGLKGPRISPASYEPWQ